MFFSDNKMSPEEIDAALNKITKAYKNLVDKYGPFFNYQEFRNRYLNALKTKTDMNIFFKGEMNHLAEQEILAQRHIEIMRGESDNPQDPEANSIQRTLNKIIEQTEAYPEAEMNDRSNIEIRRLVGMARLIYPELANLSVYVPAERSTLFYQESKVLQDVIQEPYGFTYKSYIEALGNDFLPQSQLDKIGQKLIKELAVALQTILSILRLTDPVKVGHMVDYIAKAVGDFRLDIFHGLV